MRLLLPAVTSAHRVACRGGEETINAEYEVDAARNDGVDHPFEEVVRDKERRKRLHAGDCECCRDVRIPLAASVFHPVLTPCVRSTTRR